MATRDRLHKRLVSASRTVVIFDGSELSGIIRTQHKVHIDGTVNGEIHAGNRAIVSAQGRVQGSILAEYVEIAGQVDADIECDELYVHTGAKLQGMVWCNFLNIEQGGNFLGKTKPRRLSKLKNKTRIPKLKVVENREEASALKPQADEQASQEEGRSFDVEKQGSAD